MFGDVRKASKVLRPARPLSPKASSSRLCFSKPFIVEDPFKQQLVNKWWLERSGVNKDKPMRPSRPIAHAECDDFEVRYETTVL